MAMMLIVCLISDLVFHHEIERVSRFDPTYLCSLVASFCSSGRGSQTVSGKSSTSMLTEELLDTCN